MKNVNSLSEQTVNRLFRVRATGTRQDTGSADECSIETLRSCLQANLHIKMETNLKGKVTQDGKKNKKKRRRFITGVLLTIDGKLECLRNRIVRYNGKGSQSLTVLVGKSKWVHAW